MNKLSLEKRIQILSMLVEGSSMRSTSRVCDVSINTVARYLDLAGKACWLYHDVHVRGIKGKRDVQCDEVWSYVYAKDRVADWADPWDVAGSIWTFTALDAASKLLISYMLRQRRDARSATVLMEDMASRLNKTPRLTADSLGAYRIAAANVWGSKAKLSQLRKGEDTDHNTAYVERHNLTIRMANRRFTRKTNAFSKTMARHEAAMHLFALHYNFCRIHQTLRVTPAMEAGLTDTLYDMGWIVHLIESITVPPKKPGPKLGTRYRPRSVRIQ
ncbi:MAG: IS1 family transposase [Chloroflexi bacterium]|nr:IS1 family transposase [Chloroflexota bacterium]